MCSSLCDDPKRSKRITDRKRMRLICSFTDEAPLLSPLGDDRIRIVHLILNATFGNQSSPRGDGRGAFVFFLF